MTITIEIQNASRASQLPTADDIQTWARAALSGRRERAEMAVRIVDEEEISQLNHTYRHKPGPTNVLSFCADLPPDIDAALLGDVLGDVVICAPVVAGEAREQNKLLRAHWAHMVVHGTLHLLGFDHVDEQDATEMETLETDILTRLEFPPPYV